MLKTKEKNYSGILENGCFDLLIIDHLHANFNYFVF